MSLVVKVIKNRYIDSVSLMALSTKANQVENVVQVIIAMATDMNKEVMRNVGLINDVIENAQSSDLIITMDVEDNTDEATVLASVEALLDKKEKLNTTVEERAYHTIKDAYEHHDDSNLALISVNGHYATREALQALNANLNVMMFSDNVSVEDEIMLKDLALEKGLLMMGPDCGTAIINNVGLGFANHVRKGNIGIVGASGTGSQEVSVRIHEFGGGISQMLGTGGRDLNAEIGGKMMLAGIDALTDDPNTDVIVLISKPTTPVVTEKILTRVKQIDKPVVIWFVGEMERRVDGNVHFEDMSKNAALTAVKLAGIDTSTIDLHPLNLPLIEEVRGKLKPEQKYIRGLFSGGTLASEGYFIAKQKYDNVYSNTAKTIENQIKDLNISEAHTFIDFGADEYTDGKPHPMIDPSNRVERFKQEARDPEVGVILLDFVIGYGAHEDPVGAMTEVIINGKKEAAEAGRHLEVIGYVLGTDLDSQNLQEQLSKLEATGATYASSMQNAALLAREFVGKDE
uniref:acyl-CoA synthetase FdrA n=1 Tax=Candidatus Enterococcus willemsii TaxID=1857215 RepID=UPI00403F0AAE